MRQEPCTGALYTASVQLPLVGTAVFFVGQFAVDHRNLRDGVILDQEPEAQESQEDPAIRLAEPLLSCRGHQPTLGPCQTLGRPRA